MHTQAIQLRLSLAVKYAPTSVSAEALQDHLTRAARRAIGNGLLTERGDVEVDEHSMDVAIVTGDDLPASVLLFQQSLKTNRELLEGLVTGYEECIKRSGPAPGFETFLTEQVEELTGNLSSRAANDSSNDADEKEAAISAAESWVSDNVSSDTTARLAAVLWMKGVYAGTVEILRWLQ